MIKNISYYFVFFICLFLAGCQKSSQPALTVAATAIPHAEILEFVKPDLKEKGIDLHILVVEDFNTPNRALEDREIDANFFQHLPFLEMQNEELGYQLEELVGIHLEPMALYSKKLTSLQDLKPGSVVAIPNDPTNQARALCLCEDLGLIKLKRHDAKASLLDITENPYQLKWMDLDSALLSRALDDVFLAAITTNFALQAGLLPKQDALAIENGQFLFVNYVVIRSGESQREDLQALKAALTSSKVKDFIQERYQGAISPTF